MRNWYYFLFLTICNNIYAAQVPDLYMTSGNVPINNQLSCPTGQYHRNAPVFNQLSANSLNPIRQKASNIALLQINLDKLQGTQMKLTPELVKNNIFRFVAEREHLPPVILQESVLYLQNGIVAEKMNILSPFNFINYELCQFFDKSLSALHVELQGARNFRNQLCQISNPAVQNIYLENEAVIKALEFVIDVKTQCLQQYEALIGPYNEAVQKAESCYKTGSWDSVAFGILEKQVGVLQNCIKCEEDTVAKQNAILKDTESYIASVNHFYNIFERDDLRMYQEGKAIAQAQMQQAEHTIKLCRSELGQIEPLVAYGCQYKEGIAKTIIPDVKSQIIDVYATQEIQLHATKDSGLAKAIEQAHQENYSVHSSEYSLTHETAATLEKLGINASRECILHLTGDAVQHYTHAQLIKSLDRIGSQIAASGEAKDILKIAVACNISGQEAVSQKQIAHAWEAKEACDRLLDLGLAIGEGFVEGIHNTCDNTIDLATGTINVLRLKPETLDKIATTFTRAAQSTTTFLAKFGRWAELKMENPEKGRQIRNAYLASIKDGVSQRLSEMSERDKVKFVARFATEWFLAGEIAAASGKAMRAGKVVAEEVLLNPLKSLQYEVSEALVATLEKEPALVNGFVEGIEKVGSTIVSEITEKCGDICKVLPDKGCMINGRYYTRHALERMAPKNFRTMAALEKRALEKGYAPGSKEFKEYVCPRDIPASVIEDVISNGTMQLDSSRNTVEYLTDSIKVITNSEGHVISVHQR